MYRFEAAPIFWKNYRKLNPSQQQATKRAWQIFKHDPFDSRLGTHKIHSLSAPRQRNCLLRSCGG
jgi:hypothetical protein